MKPQVVKPAIQKKEIIPVGQPKRSSVQSPPSTRHSFCDSNLTLKIISCFKFSFPERDSTLKEIKNMIESSEPLENPTYQALYTLFTNEFLQKERNSLVFDVALAFFKRPDFSVTSSEKWIYDFIKFIVYFCRFESDHDYLASLFLAIYLKVAHFREISLSCVYSNLFRIRFQDEPYISAKPLLKVLAVLIPTFSYPFSKQDLCFFQSILLPLCKLYDFSYFFVEYLQCLTKFLNFNYNYSIDACKTLVRYWPKTHSEKENLFIQILNQIIPFFIPIQFSEYFFLLKKLLIRILSINPESYQDNILMWIAQNPSLTYPVILPPMYEVLQRECIPKIRILCPIALKKFYKENPQLYEFVGANLNKIAQLKMETELKRTKTWVNIIYGGISDRVLRNQLIMKIGPLGCSFVKTK